MLGKVVPYGDIPFFWTRNYNKSLAYVGYGENFKEIHIEGDLAGRKFLAYYINDRDQVTAVAGMNNGPAVLTMFEAMQQNLMPRGSDLKSGAETPATVKTRVRKNTGGGKCSRANCCRKKQIL